MKGGGTGGVRGHLVRAVPVEKAVEVHEERLEVGNLFVCTGWCAIEAAARRVAKGGGGREGDGYINVLILLRETNWIKTDSKRKVVHPCKLLKEKMAFPFREQNHHIIALRGNR